VVRENTRSKDLSGKGSAVAELDAALDLLLGVGDRIGRDVETGDVDAGHDLGEVVKQIALATADIEDLVAGLQLVVIRHRAGDLLPAALHVAVTAIADAPVAIPIVIVPLLGELGGLWLRIFRIVHAREIVALRALVDHRHEINVAHARLS
jgi:hypothetical protein